MCHPHLTLSVSSVSSSFSSGYSVINADVRQQLIEHNTTLTGESLDLVIEVIAYIYEQAAYYDLKPGKLFESLTLIEKSQGEQIATTWKTFRTDYLKVLRSKTLGGPAMLDSVNWRLQLGLGQTSKAKQTEVNAIVNLGLSTTKTSNNNSTGEQTTEKDIENIAIEFNEEQLTAFYKQLETVQSQLDMLTAQ
jgi:hypothetical protein